MGVLYTVTPTTEEIADWLAESGFDLPDHAPSRAPLISEIRGVLDSLKEYSVEYTDNGIGACWQAMITSADNLETGAWTLLNITRRRGLSEPQEIWFEKGYPELIVEILSRLSFHCGTLVVVTDTGCDPLVITPNESPEQLCAKWEHINTNHEG